MTYPFNNSKIYKWLYGTSKWKKQSKQFLLVYKQCNYCDRKSNVVNHKIPHKGDENLFWDINNWEPACKQCHDSLIKKLENGKILGKDVVANNKCNKDGLPLSKTHPWNI